MHVNKNLQLQIMNKIGMYTFHLRNYMIKYFAILYFKYKSLIKYELWYIKI